MHRAALLIALAAVLLAPTLASAQSSAPRVYTMNIKVDFADVPAWIEYFQQHEVPILEALVEDGALQAFDLWVHHTGGEHSLRYTYVVPNFVAVAETGALYGQRLDSASAAVFGSLMSTVRQMTDGIWYIGDSDIPDGRPHSPYVYESVFQIEPASLEAWKTEFERHTRPGLERAMEEGLITAWARLDHSIGGPWNSKVVFWAASWDAIDDALELFGRTARELGATMAGSGAIRGHSDMIWSPVLRSGS